MVVNSNCDDCVLIYYFSKIVIFFFNVRYKGIVIIKVNIMFGIVFNNIIYIGKFKIIDNSSLDIKLFNIFVKINDSIFIFNK